MRLVFRSRGIRIYHGDAIDVMESLRLKVDITVTIPPYNTLGSRIPHRPSGLMANSGWIAKIHRCGYPDDLPESLYQKWLACAVALALEKSKGLVWINHKIRYRDGTGIHPVRFLDFPIHSEVVWSRNGSFALNCRRFAPSHECFWGFGRPHWWNDAENKLCSVWKIPQSARRPDHPCPFPEELPARLIRASCPPGGTVLDPFAGSFTTGVAALKSGRRFIGVDNRLEWVRAGVKRIRAAIANLHTA